MPHFSTTQRITTGGRLGHDRIGLFRAVDNALTLFVSALSTALGLLSCYVHIIKKPVNVGIKLYTINRLALSSSGIL